MNKAQIEKHGEVIRWFIDNSDKGVWFKGFMDEWELQTDPHFVEEYLYVQNDKYVELRKALADGKTVQLLMYNQDYPNGENWTDTEYIDTQKDPSRYRIN